MRYLTSLSLILFVLGQIVAIYFLFNAIKNIDESSVQSRLENRFSISIITFQDTFSNIQNSFNEVTQLLKIFGKLPSPELFTNFIQRDPNIVSYRWIPLIFDRERTAYETYGRVYYDTNFTIRDITLVGGKFIVNGSPPRPYYYPLTISIPPFTLTVMGGDFLGSSSINSTFAKALAYNGTIAGERVILVTEDTLSNYGMYISKVVHNNTYDDILGVLQTVVVPGTVMRNIATTLRVNTDFNIYIFDMETTNLIYNSQGDQFITMLYLQQAPGYVYSREVLIYGRVLLVAYEYNTDYVASLRSRVSVYILVIAAISCLLIDVSVCFSLYMHQRHLLEHEQDTNRRILVYIDHELRNPLHALNNLISLMINTIKHVKRCVPRLALEYPGDDSFDMIISDLYTMKGHIHLMNSIVNDVHIVQQLSASTVVLTYGNIELNAFVHELNTMVRSKVMEIGEVQYIKHIAEGLRFIGDADKLSQILIKLLDNAIKHTQYGSITLTIERRGRDVYFEVRDTGVGVSASDVSKLFSTTHTSKRAVTGVGLFISRALVQLMGGNINYQPNRETAGSIFWFTIPYTPWHTHVASPVLTSPDSVMNATSVMNAASVMNVENTILESVV